MLKFWKVFCPREKYLQNYQFLKLTTLSQFLNYQGKGLNVIFYDLNILFINYKRLVYIKTHYVNGLVFNTQPQYYIAVWLLRYYLMYIVLLAFYYRFICVTFACIAMKWNTELKYEVIMVATCVPIWLKGICYRETL